MLYNVKTMDQHHRKNIAPILLVMGFEYQGNGFYFNILMKKLFDFSVYSLEGCIVAIYKEGLEAGKKEKMDEIKQALQLK